MKEEKVRISVRVTEAEQEHLKRCAALCGLSVSAFLRQLCRGKKPKPMPPKAFWGLLQSLYEVHGAFQSCVPYHPAAADVCQEIERLVLALQEAG